MSSNLKKRLAALEQGSHQPQKFSGVVTYGRNETQEQAIERARRDGMTGGILVVPEVMTFEEWAEMMDREANDAGT